jgi:hypothetical protein
MNFNTSPYYDDYDEDKKFLRVLFRPGYSVQARELTQAQTILQKQVSRLGDYMFKNKARVIPGNLDVTACSAIKLQPLEIDRNVNLDSFIAALNNITITGETTGVRAQLVLGEPSTVAGDPPVIHVKYTSAGTSGNTEFLENEVLSFTVVATTQTTTTGGTGELDPEITTTETIAPTYVDPRTGVITTAATGSYRVRIQSSVDYTSNSLIASIAQGIFYVNGAFVKVDAQTISVAKFVNNPTASVGLDIVESIVTPEQDNSLLDNSTGTPNFTAPGAHRFKVALVLTTREVGYNSENFILLSTYRNGVLQYEANGTQFAELENLLARRTFDESGDYTVRPFELEIKEHRNSDQSVWTGLRNYQIGDVVFYTNPVTNQVNYYVCLDNGVSGTSAPTHVSGAVNDGGVRWRYTIQPIYDYGVYSDENGGQTSQIAFGLKNGKAYVKGYEYATNGVRYVTADKARDITRISNTGVVTTIGNLIDVIPFGVPDIENYQIVDLFKVDTPPTTGQTLGTMVWTADASGTATVNNAVSKLTYAICQYRANATAPVDYIVAKLKADNATTTTFPIASGDFTASGGTGIASAYLTTSKIGTARIRYQEANQPNNGRVTAKISLMDVQMNPGEDFRKVRVIGTPLSVGSTSTGGDPRCYRALVIPQTYNSTGVGQATIATSGSQNVDMTGLGTKWVSSGALAAGDMVWYPNVPNQFFFVRDLQSSDRTMKTNAWGSFNISGQLNRADCIYQFPQDIDSIFNMPKNDVLTIRGGEPLKDVNTTYTILQKFVITADAGNPFVTINFSVTDPDQVSITDISAYLVINNTTGETVNPADITLTTANTGQIRLIASSSRSGDITRLQNDSYTVYVPVTRRLVNAKEKTKSLVSATTELILQTVVEQDAIKLNKSDVFRILKIEAFPSIIFGNDISGQVTGTGIDITSNYEFDNGQRDTHYDLARLIKGKSVSFPPGPIRITYEYFEHSSGDYFSVDSYPDLLYEEIPNFFSKVTGRSVSLRDVLDFRPRLNDGGTFDGGSSSLTTLPQRKFGLQCDFAYYLPRKDKIVLNRQGNFVVIKGVSAENPQLPQTPSDTMELYNIEYKPYTYLANSSNVVVKQIDNKRYTMRDIAKIEKRVSNLEQVVLLSALERSTASFSIKDQDGLDRFKNGFVVDNFTGHSIGDVSNLDYECSIDIIDNCLRPAFNTVGVDLIELAGNTVERIAAGYRMHDGNVVTLPYFTGAEFYYKNKNEIQSITNKGNNATPAERFRKEALIRENSDLVVMEQPYATESTQITSLAQTSVSGIIQLFPSSDMWNETTVPAELVINEGGTYDSVAAQADALGIDFGTIWNSWQVSSLGRPVETITNSSWRSGAGTFYSSTSVVTQQVNETASGKQTQLNESVGLTEVKGRLTARQSISYIRSRPVVFTASGMKAGTRVYAFVDETDVSAYCTQATRLFLSSRTFNYEEVPFQFGATNTGRQVFLTYDVNATTGSSIQNLERSFTGSLVNNQVSSTTVFTTVFSGSEVKPTQLTISEQLNDTARNIIAANSEITAFGKGEVIRGATSGATAIVVLHEQSTNGTTGNVDGVLDTLHVVNVRGVFAAGETILGTIKKSKLNGNVLTLRLRAANHVEVSPPGALVTTGTGRVAGVWLITSGQTINNRASPRFLTGNRIFSLQDTTSNLPSSTGVVARTTYAESIYSAVGIIDAGTGSYVGTRLGTIGVGDVTRDRTFTQQLSTTTKTTYVPDPPPPPRSTDPLAQTFLISNSDSESPEGCFITEVELFFEAKDAITPVSIEIRTTVNGYPTNTTLPFAQKVIYPADIYTSAKGDVGTQIRFPAPVFVKGREMYALVVTAVSPTYRLWTSTLDKNDVSSAQLGKVLKNPVIGSLFKSSNSATWTESPLQDLKCNIYRAVFNTDTVGTTASELGTSTTESYINLRAKDIAPASNSGRTTKFTALAVNPFRVKLDSSEIIVKIPNHGMAINSVISFMNVTGSDQFGFANTDFNTDTFTQYQYDIKTSAYVETGRIVKHKVYKVYSHDLFSIRVFDAANTAKLATKSGQFGGDQMMATVNVPYTVLHPAVEVLNFQTTSTTAQVKTVSSRSPTGSETPYQKTSTWTDVQLNDNNYFTTQRAIFNKQNEADILDRESSFDMRIKLASTNKFLSPVVDLDRAMAICTQNRIDDPITTKSINSNYFSATGGFDGSEIFYSEYDTKEGGSQMGYITRKLQFKNTSKLLKVQLAAAIPSNCRVNKATASVTLPVRFQSGTRTSEHPAVITQRTAVSTTYPIGTSLLAFQSVTGLVDGMFVYGPGIQSGTRINGIASLNVTLDKPLKTVIPSTTLGSVYFFTAFDITLQDRQRQIDVGDYVTYSGAGTPIQTETFVTQAPKNTYFTKRVGTYIQGQFTLASAEAPVTLFNGTRGGIDPVTNSMTFFLDDITNIKQGMYCYIKFYANNDATYEWAPTSIRRVLRVNSDAKSITVEKLSAADEFATTAFNSFFFFNANNRVVTFFNPVIKINKTTTAAVEPTLTTRTATNLLTFTSPANAEVEVYAKLSNGGNAVTSSALEFRSNEFNIVSNPSAVDSTNDIVYFQFAHNLNTGSAVLYNAQNAAIGGLTNGQVYYAVFVSTTSIKLATSYAAAIEIERGTAGFTAINLTATAVQEVHTLTDVNQKNQASMEDDMYFRILPDISVGGDATTYGGAFPLAAGKGTLTTTDNPDEYIDHSFTADNLPPFNTAIIKISMRSQNPAFVPKIRDLRVIATV